MNPLTHTGLLEIADMHGDAWYAFDPGQMTASVTGIRDAFADVTGLRLHYSYKTNPTPALCRHALGLGMGAEVASLLEFNLCRRLGVPGDDIIMTGVVRGQDAVDAALDSGATIVVDGDRDAELVVNGTRSCGAAAPARVLLRVRVPTAGAPTPRLGMMPEHAEAVGRRLMRIPGVEVLGLHAHVTDQSVAALQARIDALCSLAVNLFEDAPRVLDFGGSLPSVAPTDALAAYTPYAAAISAAMGRHGWRDTTVNLEPGNAVVAQSVSLVARVLDVREQPDRVVANVAASVLHSSPNMRRVDFPVRLVQAPGVARRDRGLPVFVAGSTLLDGDWLVLDQQWPVQPGDFVVIDNVGAYSIAFDNSFIEPPLPIVEVTPEAWRTVRYRPGFEDAFAGFVF